jgi:photosystem II stability/assembly factor-like uncharacterized protein
MSLWPDGLSRSVEKLRKFHRFWILFRANIARLNLPGGMTVKAYRILCLSAVLTLLTVTGAAQESLPLSHHVSGNVPVTASPSQRELSAERTAIPSLVKAQLQNAATHNWQLQATLPGTVIHDMSFASPTVGYAAAEAGQVWKTTNGGKTWTSALNLGYPYYFYGVNAVTANNVVISGFYDSSTFYSLIRWSQDGGQTWSDDIVLSDTDWLQRVRFPNTDDGLILDLVGGSSGNTAQYTTDGGAGVSDWTTVVDNPSGGWFGLQFSILPNLHARASGVNFCSSPNGGKKWSCGPPVDSTFDGPVFFLNDTFGWVGGGEISPNVEGWLHTTTNGGKTWSGRTLDGPWPIREILFLNSKVGWATGGNVYTGVGGMYYSGNGGQTWTVDATTNAEMDACSAQKVSSGYQVWCAGYNENLDGLIYSVVVK